MSAPAPAKKSPSVLSTVQPFLTGGLSGMFATCCIQPIDMVKVRIQLVGETGGSKNPVAIARQIIAQDGFLSLYKGLDSALLRQASYTTVRLGIFRTISNNFQEKNGGKPLSFGQKAGAGLVAGGIGALFGTPADVVLIRMQADGTLPVEQRRNYKGVGDAFKRMLAEEGASSFFKGALPTIVRAMSLNMGMLASYDQTKEILEAQFGKGVVSFGGASAVAGFFASSMSLPFDFVKTRIQKQKPAADGTLPYKSAVDCALKVFRSEGPLAFYTGFPTYFVRIAPHSMITLLTADYLTSLYKKNFS
eukprot:GILI01000552.1.p1 GENE.GILI01000552.1~~GILI01000552.1.p1  ORF type:complete len:321 (+),score=126.85 GILI01000552.1:51-965(+)